MKNKNYYFEPAEWVAENLYLYEFYGSPTKSAYEVNTHEYLNECGIIDKKLTTKINLMIHKNNYYRDKVYDIAYNSLAGLGGVNTSDVAVPKFIENYLNCEIKSSGNTYNFDTLLNINFKFWTFEYKGLPYLIYSIIQLQNEFHLTRFIKKQNVMLLPELSGFNKNNERKLVFLNLNGFIKN